MDSGLRQRLPGLLVAALAVTLVASCSEDDGNCAAACVSSVVFELEQPASADSLRVTAEPPRSTLTCDGLRSGGACDLSSTLVAGFNQEGALTSISWQRPTEPAQVRVQIEVDSALLVDRTFDYVPRSAQTVCGKLCYRDALVID